MRRFVCAMLVAFLVFGLCYGGEKTKRELRVSCVADKRSYTVNEVVGLTVTLENAGPSEFYIYRTLEWGWAGVGFKLLDAKGKTVQPLQHVTPLPAPPVYKKSQLVGLAKGYFYGTRLNFELSHYALKPGVYYIEVSYRSNYSKDSGFGLPILTVADGEFVSNRVQIEVHSK